jgi:DNA recombination protein RmuC
MLNILLLFASILLLLVVLFAMLSRRNADAAAAERLTRIETQLARFDPLVREEFHRGREETAATARDAREELRTALRELGDILRTSLGDNTARIDGLMQTIDEKIAALHARATTSDREARAELGEALARFREALDASLRAFADSQRQAFDDLSARHAEWKRETAERLESMRAAVEQRLEALSLENANKLEQIRATVDEKLHDTLEKRLSDSFRQVSERLEQVYRGLGEMQSLATGVGDLKRVLTNVKSRGILGEIQLEAILDSILAPEQFARNVATRPGSRENVEFAIRLPGKDTQGTVVHLPIDSKFPVEAYYRLLDAHDKGSSDEIRAAAKEIESHIKRCARDIRDKYIEPPHTTDFGILFLPFEGLFAEAVRQASLVETLSREYKIMLAGPTTLAALLNSLQMGFRTLAIEKRTDEVWRVLSAVKTEFDKFGAVLKKAQEKLSSASDEIDTLVGTRTNKIRSKLREVQSLPEAESAAVFDNTIPEGDTEQ